MGTHIVKRRPPVTPPQPAELRRTTELTERQLHELIFDQVHDRVEHARDELEAELEFVDSLPEVLPEGTPVGLPSISSLRFARTVRREIRSAERAERSATAPPHPAAPPLSAAAPPPSTMPSVWGPILATPEAAPLAASDTSRSRLSGDGLSAGRALLMFLTLFLLTLGVLPVLLP